MATALEVVRLEIDDTNTTDPKFKDAQLLRYMNQAGAKIAEATTFDVSFDATTEEADVGTRELEAVVEYVKWKLCNLDIENSGKNAFSYDEGVYKVDKKGIGKSHADSCKMIKDSFDCMVASLDDNAGFETGDMFQE